VKRFVVSVCAAMMNHCTPHHLFSVMKYKSYRHNPPHLFADRSFYFLTAGTHEKQQLWFDDDRKRILFDAIEFWCEEYRCAIEAWVIFVDEDDAGEGLQRCHRVFNEHYRSH